jgi:hypothetical protein
MVQKLATKKSTTKKFDFKKGALSSIKGKPVLKVGLYHVH